MAVARLGSRRRLHDQFKSSHWPFLKHFEGKNKSGGREWKIESRSVCSKWRLWPNKSSLINLLKPKADAVKLFSKNFMVPNKIWSHDLLNFGHLDQ